MCRLSPVPKAAAFERNDEHTQVLEIEVADLPVPRTSCHLYLQRKAIMSTTTKTVSALYDTFEAAAGVVRALEAQGFAHDDISIITSHQGEHAASNLDVSEYPAEVRDDKEMATGGLVGGGAGLAAGLALMAIPGVGPLLVGGLLLTTAIGATAGMAASFTSALVDIGHIDSHADAYVQAVQAGKTLVSVRCDQDNIAGVEALLSVGASAGVPLEVIG